MAIQFNSNTQYFLSKTHYLLFIHTKSFLGTLNWKCLNQLEDWWNTSKTRHFFAGPISEVKSCKSLIIIKLLTVFMTFAQ